MSAVAATHEQFEDLEKQAHAARLGLWVFLASEVLMFSALFVLYTAYRVEHGAAFRVGIAHSTRVLGSCNTAILIVSSGVATFGLSAMRAGRRGVAAACTGATALMGLGFLAIKIIEWVIHAGEGIAPGGHGRFFAEHADPGLPTFWTMYYAMTGLHAVHVLVGVGVMTGALIGIATRKIEPETSYRLECCVMYWSLVDFIWLFLWTVFYVA